MHFYYKKNFIIITKKKIFKIYMILTIFFFSIKYNIIKFNFIFSDDINIEKYINLKYFKIKNSLYKNNFNLLLSKKKTKIENIFTLIAAIPFLKYKIIIKKKNKEIYRFCRDIFRIKKNKKIIIINKVYYNYIIKNIKYLIYYKWELIPKIYSINYLRYIINNYYNEICLQIFDKALTLNLRKYIEKNKKNFSFKDINNLMSKF